VQRLGYRPELDGLRALAIAVVVLGHARLLPNGWNFGYGVDLFFVLSGFLITTLLMEEWRSTGTICLRDFYARRVRRLLPALAGFLTVLGIIGLVAVERGTMAWHSFVSAAIASVYLSNFFAAFHAQPAPHYLTHLWSLANEEQFYLVWPLVLIGALRTRATIRQLRLLLLAGFVFTFAFQLDSVRWSSLWFYGYSPLTRSMPIVIGCLVALMQGRIRHGQWIGMALFAGAVIGPAYIAAGGRIANPFWNLATAVGSALLVSHAGRPFTWRPLVMLGVISYSLYLWHPLFIHALPDATGYRALAVALSLAAAVASYRWIERPFRRRRQHETVGREKLEPAIAGRSL
jgi:peptidoglycan/LPS O-acetylase OafA/YrhL